MKVAINYRVQCLKNYSSFSKEKLNSDMCFGPWKIAETKTR